MDRLHEIYGCRARMSTHNRIKTFKSQRTVFAFNRQAVFDSFQKAGEIKQNGKPIY